MTIDAIAYIQDELEKLGINYEFGMYTSHPVKYPYFVGEYSEVGEANEDGMDETTFIITGTTRGSLLELEEEKEKIRNHFKEHLAILGNSNGIAIYYSNAFTVPTDNDEIRRIQINLTIKEWKVE